MIGKNDLLGKNISYTDRDGKFRISKCHRINGRTLTVGKKISGRKFDWERIHPDRNKIFGAIIRRKLVEIEW